MRRVGRNQGRNFVPTRRLSFLLIQTKLPSTPPLSRRRFSCDPLNENTHQSSLRQNVSRLPGSDCRRLFQQPPSQLFSVGSRCTAVPTGDHLSSYMQTRRHHVQPTTKAMRVEGDPRIRQVNAYNRRPAFLRALPLAFVVRDRMVRTMLGAIITLVFLSVSGVGAFGAGPSSPSESPPSTAYSGGWGTKPMAEEEPVYLAQREQLKSRIRQLDADLEPIRQEREKIWGSWSEAEREKARAWFRKSPHFSPEAYRLFEETKDRLTAAESRKKYHEDNNPKETLAEPQNAVARNFVWSSHLEWLRAEVEHREARLYYDRFERNGIGAYAQSGWTGLNWDQVWDDAADHAWYVYLDVSDRAVDDLLNCIGKSLANFLRRGALNQSARTQGWTGSPEGITGGRQEYFKLFGGDLLGCGPDTIRAAFVNFIVANWRKGFVDRMAGQGVYPEVAEYWWTQFVWESPKLDPEKRIQLQGRLGSRLERAFAQWATRSPYVEQTKEQMKDWLRTRATERIRSETLREFREAADAIAGRAGQGAIRPEDIPLLKRAANNMGERVAKGRADDLASELINKVEYAMTAVEMHVTHFGIWYSEMQFEKEAELLFAQYKEIQDCLAKLEMATGPAAIIGIYDLSPDAREDFFRRCKGPSREQREQILREVQNLSGQIWDLAERATGYQEAARRDCEAAVAAARAAGSSLDRVPDPADLQRRAALLPSRVQAAQDGAQECAAAAAQAGQAMISAEGAAAEACKSLQDLARKKTVGDRQAVFGTVVKNVSEAKGHYASCQGFIQTASLAAARTDTVAKTAAAEADALAALLRDASGSSNAIGAADGEVAQARNLLATSRGTSASIADLHTQVSPVVQKAEGISRPLAEDPQIRKILEDIYAQQKRVAALLGGPTDCWAIADAEIKKVQGKRAARDGNALSPPIYPNVLKQAAAAAGQQAANALAFFSEYDQRARKALEGAAFCQALAEDLAKTSATANASGGAGNGPCLPGNIAGDSGLDCPADRDRALAAMDCSGLPGSVAVWSEKEQRPGCACPDPPGWNANKTACNVDHATALAALDCPRLKPGSVTVWSDSQQRAGCTCPDPLVWNGSQTACVSDRDRQLAMVDCSRYPGSQAGWDEARQKAGCTCSPPKNWNAAQTACVAVSVTTQDPTPPPVNPWILLPSLLEPLLRQPDAPQPSAPSQPRATPEPVRRTVSGGLDQAEVRKRVDGRRAEGKSVQFQSGTVTLEINPGGIGRVSANLTFEGQFRIPATAPPDIRKFTFVLYPGQCDRDGSSCTGKGTRKADLTYKNDRRSFPAGEIEWRASRQADGSYTFWVPNGEAPLWSEIIYRLR